MLLSWEMTMTKAFTTMMTTTGSLWICAMALYASSIEIGGGALELGGTLAASGVIVASGASLGGSGNIDGDLALAGTISPGSASAAIGGISVSGAFACRTGSVFVCDVSTHVTGDTILADAVSGPCKVVVRQVGGAIPVGLEILDGTAGSDYGDFVLDESQAGRWLLSPAQDDLLLTDLVGDSDGDAIADWWEVTYFSGRTNAVAGADGDGDGASNLDEHIAGTDPGNPASRFAIASLASSNGDIVVTWTSSTGRHYRVQHATNPSLTFLPIASNILADPPYNSYRDEKVNHEIPHFYRIAIQ